MRNVSTGDFTITNGATASYLSTKALDWERNSGDPRTLKALEYFRKKPYWWRKDKQ